VSIDITPKQEVFACAYVETNNASDAYRRAYNCEKMQPQSIHVNACKLLKDTKVALRIEELRQIHAQRHGVTVDSLTKMMRDAYDLAMNGQPAAAVSAVLGMAKLHGLIVEKKHVDQTVTHVSKPLSETLEWVEGVLRERQAGKHQKPVSH
jgi:phage terminase small subunit